LLVNASDGFNGFTAIHSREYRRAISTTDRVDRGILQTTPVERTSPLASRRWIRALTVAGVLAGTSLAATPAQAQGAASPADPNCPEGKVQVQVQTGEEATNDDVSITSADQEQDQRNQNLDNKGGANDFEKGATDTFGDVCGKFLLPDEASATAVRLNLSGGNDEWSVKKVIVNGKEFNCAGQNGDSVLHPIDNNSVRCTSDGSPAQTVKEEVEAKRAAGQPI
jgi:hypothetical protein